MGEGEKGEGGGEGDGGRTAVDKEASHFYNFVLFCHVLNEPGNNASSSVGVLVSVTIQRTNYITCIVGPCCCTHTICVPQCAVLTILLYRAWPLQHTLVRTSSPSRTASRLQGDGTAE